MKTLNDLPRVTIKEHKAELSSDTNAIDVSATNDNGQTITTSARITNTPCNYGGLRYWFICDDCNERASVLYCKDDSFCCSKCTGLPYKSQMQQKKDRILNRIKEIRRKLKWTDDINDGHGPKPKGIWHSTYYRLMNEHDQLLYAIS